MKKTLLTIAIAAALTGTAFATNGDTGSASVVSNSAAATGSTVVSSSTGNNYSGAIMGSTANAWNQTSAGYNTGARDGSGVGTEASSVGGSSSLSGGEVWGNGGGVTSGVAGQSGLGQAQARDGGFGDNAAAGSVAGVGSLSGTMVYGNGFSAQSTFVKAENQSSAYGDGDSGFAGASANTAAETGGETYSKSTGVTFGDAIGATGGVATQGGYAEANAIGEAVRLLPPAVGGTLAHSEAATGSLSATGVLMNGYVKTGAETWAGNKSEGKVCLGGCGTVSTSAGSAGSAGVTTWSYDPKTYYGVDGAYSVGYASQDGSALAGGKSWSLPGIPTNGSSHPNNGWGNGDQYAPGNSGPNNNAENWNWPN